MNSPYFSLDDVTVLLSMSVSLYLVIKRRYQSFFCDNVKRFTLLSPYTWCSKEDTKAICDKFIGFTVYPSRFYKTEVVCCSYERGVELSRQTALRETELWTFVCRISSDTAGEIRIRKHTTAGAGRLAKSRDSEFISDSCCPTSILYPGVFSNEIAVP